MKTKRFNNLIHRMQKAVAFFYFSGLRTQETHAKFCGSLLHSVIGNVGHGIKVHWRQCECQAAFKG